MLIKQYPSPCAGGCGKRGVPYPERRNGAAAGARAFLAAYDKGVKGKAAALD